jgi:ABC-type uncharacterized transport system involved in gliding motility auxiliary subunit
MKLDRQARRRLSLQNTAIVVLLLALVVIGVLAARDNRREFDVTANARNTLSQASIDVLRSMPGPITITAYATPQDAKLGDIRRLIAEFMRRYQRVKPDIELRFVDPREQPKLASQAGIQMNGEMVVAYGQRSEHLAALAEQEFTNLLTRLARPVDRLVVWLDGHGERRLDGRANHDLGDFGRHVGAKGIQVSPLNLALAQEVPANAHLLVVASPQVDLAPAEVEKVVAHVKRGGNLLWMLDQEPLRGLGPLAEALGLVLSPGVVVDPSAAQRDVPPTMAIGAAYGRHAVTRNLRRNTLYPFARRIEASPPAEWKVTPLVEVGQRGWVETGRIEQGMRFDKDRDTPGPVTIAVAMERTVSDRAQRVVVVGTGHFLSNTYLGNGGNLDLGVSMVNWLAGDDSLVAIESRATVDGRLDLSRAAMMTIAFGFLIVAPVAFWSIGAAIWWRRRRR